MTAQTIEIEGRRVGSGEPCFIIAEAGVNHNGDLGLARQLVDVAAEAGADSIKFQTFQTDELVIEAAPKAEYQKRTTQSSESHYEMLQRLELSADDHAALYAYCHEKGIQFLSSVFDEGSVDLLGDLGVGAIKMPSGEITNLPLMARVARQGLPMIVSTGMADLGEVETAVRIIRGEGNDQIVLLHCVSNYPADASDVNLRAMQTMGAAFGVSVGYSDHTLGIEVPIAAVALGATVIEKHFTLDRGMPGPDHAASLEPSELASMVKGIRSVESALGHGRKEPVASEASTAAVARKSLVAVSDIPMGTVLAEEMLAVKRPGDGLPPAMLEHLIGRTVRADVPTGALLTLEMLA